jgi:Flp pilus assembly protein TadD
MFWHKQHYRRCGLYGLSVISLYVVILAPASAERADTMLAFDLFKSHQVGAPNAITSPRQVPGRPPAINVRPVDGDEKARLDALLNNPKSPQQAQTTPVSDLLDLPKQPNPSLPRNNNAPVNPSTVTTTPPRQATGVPPNTRVKKPRPWFGEKPLTTPPNKAPITNAPLAIDADIDEYNKGVELFQVAQGQAEKGNVNGQQVLLQEAVKHFRQALQLNPKRVESQSNIGFVELTLRRYKPAVRAFEQALRIQPDHPNTLNGLATAFTLLDQPDNALRVLNRLLQVAPDNAQYWFNQGCVLQKTKRFDAARKSYAQALSINPSDQRTLFNLATLAEAQGNQSEAIRLFTQAKNTGIDTPIGLEAYRRLQALQPAAPQR